MLRCLIHSVPRRLGVLVVVLLTLVSTSTAQEGPTVFRLGKVLGLHYHAVPEEGRAMLERLWPQEVYPFAERHLPGADLVLLRGDRGSRPTGYLTLWNLESVEARDRYYPEEETPSAEMQRIDGLWMNEIGYGFGGLFTTSDFVGDYILVGDVPWDEPPAFEMLGLHHFSVTPGREAEFEQFISRTFHRHSHVGDLWTLLYRADRGSYSGDYVRVYVIARHEARDRYWPPPDGQWSESLTALMDPIMDLWAEQMAFYSARHEWNDWFVVH